MWEQGMTAYAPYECLYYDGSEGCKRDLLAKDLFVAEENGRTILKEMVSLSKAITIGKICPRDDVVIILNTVLIVERGGNITKTLLMNMLKRIDRLESERNE